MFTLRLRLILRLTHRTSHCGYFLFRLVTTFRYGLEAGTTAVVAVTVGDRLIVAHVGDSRCV